MVPPSVQSVGVGAADLTVGFTDLRVGAADLGWASKARVRVAPVGAVGCAASRQRVKMSWNSMMPWSSTETTMGAVGAVTP